MAMIYRPVAWRIAAAVVLQQCGTPRAYGYMTAFLGQSERNTFADAGAASGYECGLIL